MSQSCSLHTVQMYHLSYAIHSHFILCSIVPSPFQTYTSTSHSFYLIPSHPIPSHPIQTHLFCFTYLAIRIHLCASPSLSRHAMPCHLIPLTLISPLPVVLHFHHFLLDPFYFVILLSHPHSSSLHFFHILPFHPHFYTSRSFSPRVFPSSFIHFHPSTSCFCQFFT